MNENALAVASANTGGYDTNLANGVEILPKSALLPALFVSIKKPKSSRSTSVPVTPVIEDPLSRKEIEDFQACEKLMAEERDAFIKANLELDKVRQDHLHRVWDAFVKAGQALARIRDGRLYRQEFSSFEQYCEEKWHYKKAHAYRLIAAAETVKCLSPMGDALPKNERQVRPLNGLNDEQKQIAWQKAIVKADDKEITVKHVQNAVDELIPPQKKRKASAKHKDHSKAVSIGGWQQAYKLVQRTIFLVNQGGNHPENTVDLLKALEAHLHKMESACLDISSS